MENKTSKTKRIAALIGVILLVIMVIATVVTAIVDPTGVWFRSCLIVTIALPIALWVFIWALGALTNKHTMASFDLGEIVPENNGQSSDEDSE